MAGQRRIAMNPVVLTKRLRYNDCSARSLV